MIFKDDIYGNFEVNDPIIIDLIRTYPLRRLKGIDTAGYSQAFYPGKSRTLYDHSIGVFLLLRKFDTSIEEQIAGLIHEVSNFAFSSAIEYINSGDQKLAKKDFDEFVRDSEVARMLKRYGCDIEYVLNEMNFPLQHSPLPELTADIVDDCLNEGVQYGYRRLEEVQELLSHLQTSEQKVWYFDSMEYAEEFAQLFKELNDKEYAGVKSAMMNKSIKDVMTYSLSKSYINAEDFEKDNVHILSKLVKFIHSDSQLNKYWQRMNNKVVFENNTQGYEEEVWCRSQIVDPYFLSNGNLTRLSETDIDWKNTVEQGLKPKQYFVKVMEE